MEQNPFDNYRKLSHVIYDCRYHIVFVPKYRFRILEGEIAACIQEKFQQICEWKEINLIEGNTNKNRNGLVRFYLPYDTDFDFFTAEIKRVENLINNCPMKCLNYQTPNEVFKIEMNKIYSLEKS